MDRRTFVRRSVAWTTAGAALGAASAGRAGAASGAGPAPAPDPRRVDVRAFGAAGDGRADDSAALERAVEARSGHLFLSRGDYRITRTIRIPLEEHGRTSVLGDGSARVLMAGAGPAFHFAGTHAGTALPSSFRDTVWERERMPLVTGFEIVGAHPEADGVRLEKTTQAILADLAIRRCRVGLHFVARNRNPIVSRCQIYHNHEIGVFFDAVNLHQAIIADSHISYNPVAGILLRGGDMRNFQIVGNDIEYNYAEARDGSADILIDMTAADASFREGTIAGNTIQARPSPHGANIRFLGGEGHRSGGLLAISGNMIGNQSDNIHLRRCRAVAMTGNSIYSAMERTLRLEQCANVTFGHNAVDWNPHPDGKTYVDGFWIEECDGVVLSGTVLENSSAGSAEKGGSIEVHRSRDVTIADCQVLDPHHRGIVFDAVTRGRVTGCTVLRRDGKSLEAAIEVRGASRHNLVALNTTPPGGIHAAEGTARVEGTLEVDV